MNAHQPVATLGGGNDSYRLFGIPPLRLTDLNIKGLRKFWSRRRLVKELEVLRDLMAVQDPWGSPAWEALLKERPYVAMQQLAVRAFDLRVKEALLLRPVLDDKGALLRVRSPFGGFNRSVKIDNEFQLQVLCVLKHFVIGLTGHGRGGLKNPNMTWQQNMTAYRYVKHLEREEARSRTEADQYDLRGQGGAE